ncbi:MAG: Fructose-1,6-bisphosphatase [Methanocella sp. PtaU1.Bin125]|nr:MAG: Fructose-1,6-bisphosphatase [Methanocella sp. PtaU1.Bin125]
MDAVTLSVIKADVGSYVGHSQVHPDLLAAAKKLLARQKLIEDYHVTNCGDDLELILTHREGVDSPEIHNIAWDVFMHCTEVAKSLKLYGAGQDMLADSFAGNVRGMGPGVAEMEIVPRKSEPVIVFMADKTSPSAFSLPLYRIFADPFCSAGLILDPKLHDGFRFEVLDIEDGRRILLDTPEELYDVLALIGIVSRYLVKRVYRKDGEIAAAASTEKLSKIAGEYVGKDDPVAIVRCQSGFPAVGEVLEPFAFPHLVPGFMRGSHNGPLMPVAQPDAHPRRFDGPPRIIALGFQLNGSRLVGPVDLFDDPSFEGARRKANEIADYMRSHGPFQPHLLGVEDLEYTTLPKVLDRLHARFETLAASEKKGFSKKAKMPAATH